MAILVSWDTVIVVDQRLASGVGVGLLSSAVLVSDNDRMNGATATCGAGRVVLDFFGDAAGACYYNQSL